MKNFLYAFALLFTVTAARAQQPFCFVNASIEGTPGPGIVPGPWTACYGSPDTQPGQWGITQAPSNGNTYVSFLHSGWSANGYNEGMTQQVTPCLNAGQSYTFTVDLAHTNIYNTAPPNGCYSSLAVYGGASPCAQTELLWTSGAFYQTNWQTFTVTFTPSQNWCYISFSPYFITPCGNTGFDYINCMMDNLSCISPSGVAGGTNPTCYGQCDGTGNAYPNGGTPPYTYLWLPGNQTTQSISGLCAGSYTLTVTDANGQTFADTLVLNNPPQLQAVTQQVNSTCATGCNGVASVTLNGGTAPYTYSWQPGGQTSTFVQGLCAGTYTVTGTDLNGCSVVDTFTITSPPPIVVNTPAPVTICNGQPVTLTASASGGTPAYNYVWQPGSMSGNSVSVTPTTNTTYTVIVTDANNCTSSQTTTVNISPLTYVDAGNNVTICDYDSSRLSPQTQTVNGVTFSWSPASGLSSTSVANPWASPTATTTYTVTASDGTCTYSDSVTVSVSSVLAAFSATPPGGTVPLSVSFTNNSVNGNSYQWNFGDGSPIDVNASPSHTYTNTGTYTVTLIVMNSNGCYDTTTFILIVEQPYSLVIPNVFTPNGDGSNDVFAPQFTGVAELACQVYNRWGELVYNWNTLNGSWNGKVKSGGMAPDGTYYFVMQVKAMDGTEHIEKGYVILLQNK